jgi:hypothetical protein
MIFMIQMTCFMQAWTGKNVTVFPGPKVDQSVILGVPTNLHLRFGRMIAIFIILVISEYTYVLPIDRKSTLANLHI